MTFYSSDTERERKVLGFSFRSCVVEFGLEWFSNLGGVVVNDKVEETRGGVAGEWSGSIRRHAARADFGDDETL